MDSDVPLRKLWKTSSTAPVMNTIALISDIHGNAVALDAVLADIAASGVAVVVCLGDVVACGPEPEAVIERLHQVQATCVLGNTDEWLLGRLLPQPHQREYAALMELIDWGANAISDEARRYLATLPPRREVVVGEKRVLCFHASPRSSTEAILAETAADELAEVLAPFAASAYACGHTHLQLLRRVGSALVVNPGSVGVPLAPGASPLSIRDGHADYAVVSAGSDGVDVRMRRVAVDGAAARAAARASGMPYHDQWAAILARRVTRSNERARAG
jgi:putative phosphoesterase